MLWFVSGRQTGGGEVALARTKIMLRANRDAATSPNPTLPGASKTGVLVIGVKICALISSEPNASEMTTPAIATRTTDLLTCRVDAAKGVHVRSPVVVLPILLGYELLLYSWRQPVKLRRRCSSIKSQSQGVRLGTSRLCISVCQDKNGRAAPGRRPLAGGKTGSNPYALPALNRDWAG